MSIADAVGHRPSMIPVVDREGTDTRRRCVRMRGHSLPSGGDHPGQTATPPHIQRESPGGPYPAWSDVHIFLRCESVVCTTSVTVKRPVSGASRENLLVAVIVKGCSIWRGSLCTPPSPVLGGRRCSCAKTANHDPDRAASPKSFTPKQPPL